MGGRTTQPASGSGKGKTMYEHTSAGLHSGSLETEPQTVRSDQDRFLDELADELSGAWTALPTPRQQAFRAYVREELPRVLNSYASAHPDPAQHALPYMRGTGWFRYIRPPLKRGFLRKTRKGSILLAHIFPVVMYALLFAAIMSWLLRLPAAGPRVLWLLMLSSLPQVIGGIVSGLACPRFAVIGIVRSMTVALLPVAIYIGWTTPARIKIPFHFPHVMTVEKVLEAVVLYLGFLLVVVLPTMLSAAMTVEIREEIESRLS